MGVVEAGVCVYKVSRELAEQAVGVTGPHRALTTDCPVRMASVVAVEAVQALVEPQAAQVATG
jgi:hypothetical protein